ncbi:MAG: hypothetical protein JWP13_713, partial [Candidatus Saccharibacteria bacterium]|nr:hypothetical protein [Candidatus Saccharibacteria bacterium]
MATSKLPANLNIRTKNQPKAVKKRSSKAVTKKISPAPKSGAAKQKLVNIEATKGTQRRLPPAWKIARDSVQLLWRNRWLFLGIATVYALVNLLLLGGVRVATDLAPVRDVLNEGNSAGVGRVGTGLALYALIVADANSKVGDVLGAYQFFSLIITSLAVIWALRQVMVSGVGLRIRDAFYKGMYPLIPAVLILLLIIAQLVPLAIGASIYALLISNEIVIGLLEKILWTIPLFIGLGISMFWLTSSVIAAYIVTLPDMTPMKALRSARNLVRYRRWAVIRKLVFLPAALLLISAVIMLP